MSVDETTFSAGIDYGEEYGDYEYENNDYDNKQDGLDNVFLDDARTIQLKWAVLQGTIVIEVSIYCPKIFTPVLL